MGNISDLEKKFKLETENEIQKLKQIENSVFREIENDLIERWKSNANTLENAMNQHNKKMIRTLEESREKMNSRLKLSLVILVVTITLSVMLIIIGTIFGEKLFYSDQFKELEIVPCNSGISMCAVGTYMTQSGKIYHDIKIVINKRID